MPDLSTKAEKELASKLYHLAREEKCGIAAIARIFPFHGEQITYYCGLCHAAVPWHLTKDKEEPLCKPCDELHALTELLGSPPSGSCWVRIMVRNGVRKELDKAVALYEKSYQKTYGKESSHGIPTTLEGYACSTVFHQPVAASFFYVEDDTRNKFMDDIMEDFFSAPGFEPTQYFDEIVAWSSPFKALTIIVNVEEKE